MARCSRVEAVSAASGVDVFKQTETILRQTPWESLLLSQLRRLIAETKDAQRPTLPPHSSRRVGREPCGDRNAAGHEREATSEETVGNRRRAPRGTHANRAREGENSNETSAHADRGESDAGWGSPGNDSRAKPQGVMEIGNEGDCKLAVIGGFPLRQQTLEFDSPQIRMLLEGSRNLASVQPDDHPDANASRRPSPLSSSASPRPFVASAPSASHAGSASPSPDNSSDAVAPSGGLLSPSSARLFAGLSPAASVASAAPSESGQVRGKGEGTELESVGAPSSLRPASDLSAEKVKDVHSDAGHSPLDDRSAPVSIYEVVPGALFLPAYLSVSEQLCLACECLSVYSMPPHVCNLCNLIHSSAEPSVAGASSSSSHFSSEQAGREAQACADGAQGEQTETAEAEGGRDVICRRREGETPSQEAAACRRFDGNLSRASLSPFLKKQLRWVTLGRHYDWTKRSYDEETNGVGRCPSTRPLLSSLPTSAGATPAISPSFAKLPAALEKLCDDILQLCEPYLADAREGTSRRVMDAAILNVYRSGDRLRGHKDDAERAEEPLVSISIGQPAIFLLGGDSRQVAPKALVLRSGDVLVLSGVARWAIHGVPKLLYYNPVISLPAPRRRKKLRAHASTMQGGMRMSTVGLQTQMYEWRCSEDRQSSEGVVCAARNLVAAAGLSGFGELHADSGMRLLATCTRRGGRTNSGSSSWLQLLEVYRRQTGDCRHDSGDIRSGTGLNGHATSTSDQTEPLEKIVGSQTANDVVSWLGELRLNLSCRCDES